MHRIISNHTYIPVRNEPQHRAEQVTQLIYGETAIVIDSVADWYKIHIEFDAYEGWIEKKVVVDCENPATTNTISLFTRLVRPQGTSIWLSSGSEINSAKLKENTEMLIAPDTDYSSSNVIDIASQFLGTPYLWGGRTFMGIDCSGFVQVVFKSCGVKLPRDASQQISSGSKVESVSVAKPGDLAFFENENGKITHVGIVLPDSLIIHASGSVRIDVLDEKGILNRDTRRYSHKLCMLRRCL